VNISTRIAAPTRECLHYRDGVGILLYNARGDVWLGQRRPRWLAPDSEPIWQMPQGGLHARELPLETVLREVREETGANSVSATAVLDRWLSFDRPDHLLGIAQKGRYRGQRQLWFALRFNGSDGEFDVRRHVAHRPEFEGWTWAPPCDAISRAVPWKKTMYATVLRKFGGLVKAV